MKSNIELQTVSTKEKILNAAVKLFSDYGYKEVSVRDIARDVGIKDASIYSHFASKKEILISLYDFYSKYWKVSQPKLADLALLAESAPPYDVLMRLDFRFAPNIEETMNRIMKIATRQISVDPCSEQFIKEHIVTSLENVLKPLLIHMIGCRRIQPINVDALNSLISHYTLGVTMSINTSLQVSEERWDTELRMIFSLVQVIG